MSERVSEGVRERVSERVVPRVAQQALVVGADVDGAREHRGRVDARAGDVQVELADADAHALSRGGAEAEEEKRQVSHS